MDFVRPGEQPDEEVNIGDMTPFAAGVFARQPFRGYELRSALGSTDRTAAFKARDFTMERTVVVKVLHPCRERDGAVEEFFSLAGSIARLRCPGVARGLDVGRGDGDFFLVYEYARGESLADRMARLQAGKLAEKDSLRAVAATARVLQNLFEHGHPHGHLTPANIIQGEGGRVKLADVGFAWNMAYLDDAAAFRTSPHYLPPERIDGEFNVDIRGDLYSLGAIWFRLLAGRHVFEGDTPDETLRMHCEEKPGLLHRIDEKITETTSTLVRWLLEKDRDARPRTPKEFLRRLASHPLLAGMEELEGMNEAALRDGDDEKEGLAVAVAREVDELIGIVVPDIRDAAATDNPASESADGEDEPDKSDNDGEDAAESAAPVPELSEDELFEPGQVIAFPARPGDGTAGEN